MSNFQIPLHPEDLLLPVPNRFTVQNETRVDSLSEAAINKLIDDTSSRLKRQGARVILEHETFDVLFSLLLRFDSLTTALASRLFETLLAGLVGIVKLTGDQLKGEQQQQPEQLERLKNALKMHVFLVHWFVAVAKPGSAASTAAKKGAAATATGAKAKKGAGARKKARVDGDEESGAAAGGGSGASATPKWEEERAKEELLSALINLLELDLARVWRAAQPEEPFVNLFSKTLVTLLPCPPNLRLKAVRRCLLMLCALLIKRYQYGPQWTTALVTLLHSSAAETLAQPLAELYALLDSPAYRPAAHAAVGDLLREIGRMSSAQISPIAKNMAEFLRELAERLPAIVLPNLAVLLPHLDGEVHWMRIGIVQLLGQLLFRLYGPEQQQQQQQQQQGRSADGEEEQQQQHQPQQAAAEETRRSMEAVLEQRVFDVNPYVRGQTLQTWSLLAQHKAIPLSRLEHVARLAVSRLSDKNFNVRRSAVGLVQTLMEYNPFGPSLALSPYAGKLADLRRLRQELRQHDAERAQAFLDEQQQQRAAAAEDEEVGEESDEAEGEEDDEREEEDEGAEEREPAARTKNSSKKKKNRKKKSKNASAAAEDPEQEEADDEVDGEEQDDDDDDVAEDEDDDDDEAADGRKKKKKQKATKNAKRKGQGKSRHQSKKMQAATKPAAGGAEAMEEEEPAAEELNDEQLAELGAEEAALRQERQRQERLYAATVRFIERLHEAVPLLCQLLGSKLQSDVLDTVDCFVTASQFGLERAPEGLRRMLPLVWSSEAKIRERLVEAYRQLYIVPSDTADPTVDPNLVTAKNLIGLTVNATLGDLTSLEELVGALYAKDYLTHGLVQTLWAIFGAKHKRLTQNAKTERRGALVILSMLANAQPDIVKNKLNVLVNVGLGTKWKDDVFLARYTCIALQKLARCVSPSAAAGKGKEAKNTDDDDKENQHRAAKSPEKDGRSRAAAGDDNSSSAVAFQRLPSTHVIFKRLADVVLERDLPHSSWYALAEQAINTVYVLSEHPDKVCETIIKTLAPRVFPGLAGGGGAQQEQQPEAEAKADDDDDDDAAPAREAAAAAAAPRVKCGVSELSKLLFTLGHVALKQIVHVDAIQSELRRRRADVERLKQQKQQEQADNAAKKKRTSKGSGGKKAEQQQQEQQEKQDHEGRSTIEQELGVAQAAEEHEAERLQETAEREMVSRNLLGAFGQLVANVCANKGNQFNDPTLRAAAVLCLCKFMCVSADFCEAHLPLLFTLFKRAPEAVIRSNIVIVMGDLAVRFPVLLEPWTHEMYRCLHDDNFRVRKSAFMVLAHLVLNDQIRVRGQISEMAACLADSERRMTDLARLFFTELSRKGNAIYNLLPDVISALSGAESAIGAEAQRAGEPTAKFKDIMRFLFDFIDKEKQSESLVDKLCHRFQQTADQVQWRNIAFCLSLLNYSDKALRRLNENAKPMWLDKLHDPQVRQAFEAIASKVRKFARAEVKEVLAEFEAKLASPDAAADSADPAAAGTAADGAAATSPGKQQQVGGGAKAAAAGKSTAAKGRPARGRKATSAAAAVKKRTKAAVKYDSSEEDDDDDENDVVLGDDESDDAEDEQPAEAEQAPPKTSRRARSKPSATKSKPAGKTPAKRRAKKTVISDGED